MLCSGLLLLTACISTIASLVTHLACSAWIAIPTLNARHHALKIADSR